MSTVSIYFILGKVQESLVESLVKKENGECIVFSTYNSNLDHVIRIGSFYVLFNYFKIIFLLFKIKKFDRIRLYTPHNVNFLSNIILSKGRGVELNYLYDGILNFREVGWSNSGIKKVLFFNKVKAALFFSRHVKFGITINDDTLPCFSKVFFPDYCQVGCLDHNDKAVYVPIKNHVVKVKSEKTLMVLEPVFKNSKDNNIECYLASLREFCETKGVREVVLKLHPSVSRSLAKDYLLSFCVLKDFDDRKSAEEVYSDLYPQYLLGDCSSALINIKLLDPFSNVYSFAKKMDRQEVDDLSSVLSLMEDVGVEFL